MPSEQLVLYLVIGAIAFVKFVLDTLKRGREIQTAERAPEPAGQELGGHWWEPHVEPDKPEARPETEPPPTAALKRPAEPAAPRPARREPAARARSRKAVVQPALRHRTALGSRTELRRAVELMAILGPPRSLAPYDS